MDLRLTNETIQLRNNH